MSKISYKKVCYCKYTLLIEIFCSKPVSYCSFFDIFYFTCDLNCSSFSLPSKLHTDQIFNINNLLTIFFIRKSFSFYSLRF